MNITSNVVNTIDDTKQTCYFTLTNDSSEDFLYHCNMPVLSGNDLQDHLDLNVEDYYLDILLKQYPGAIYTTSSGNTDLEKMEQWIEDGHTNVETEEIIDLVPFVSTHTGSNRQSEYLDRAKISTETEEALSNATTVSGLRDILMDIFLGSS